MTISRDTAKLFGICDNVTEPNGVCSPVGSKANLLTLGCSERKYSIYCRAQSKGNGQLMFKRLELPDEFHGRGFKGTQGANGGWVILGLEFKWFPLCEFSLFDTP